MKALLMHPERDFDLEQPLPPPPHDDTLMQDLEIGTLLKAMAGDDELLLQVARKALLNGLHDEVDTILYRQEVLLDCLANPEAVRELYGLTIETMERRRKSHFGYFMSLPSSILSSSVELMRMFVDMLKILRSMAETHAPSFSSRAFTALFATLQRELGDDYFGVIEDQLKELKFSHGVLLSARLGKGNMGQGYVLRLLGDKRPTWLRRLLGHGPREYTFHLPERDEAGARALSELQDQGLNLAANALAQSAEHILSFFVALRTELAFYVGCLNLRDRLVDLGLPTCVPTPLPGDVRGHRFSELYDPCLALSLGRAIVGNTVDAQGCSLAIVTGANQGGKSSFLRSIGVAQLMMQSGMFVGAQSFAAEVCTGLFTHYKREEDATMKSGKFDEELARMNRIAELVAPGALVLFNESFASTNEREGSEVARQIVAALLERRVKVFCVTHMYDFSHGIFAARRDDAIFLRAERLPDGTRPFKLVGGEPLETSYGDDLYREVFEAEARESNASPVGS